MISSLESWQILGVISPLAFEREALIESILFCLTISALKKSTTPNSVSSLNSIFSSEEEEEDEEEEEAFF